MDGTYSRLEGAFMKKSEAKVVALAVRQETRQQVLALNRQGYDNWDISEHLGLPYPHVVAEVLRLASMEQFADKKKFQRVIEAQKLEHLYRKAYQAFDTSGSVDWYDRLLKTSERKSKLLGLDSPVEQVVTGKDGGAIKFESVNMKGLTDDELSTMKALAMKASKAVETPEPE
jgi:hypothetical protein